MLLSVHTQFPDHDRQARDFELDAQVLDQMHKVAGIFLVDLLSGFGIRTEIIPALEPDKAAQLVRTTSESRERGFKVVEAFMDVRDHLPVGRSHRARRAWDLILWRAGTGR